MNTLPNYLEEYLNDYGWSIVPVKFIFNGKKWDKIPCLKTWKEYQLRRPTEEEVLGWINKYNPEGWGLVCGKISQVVSIDVDNPNLDLGLSSPMQFQSAFSKGYHYLYRWTDQIQPNVRIEGMEVDFRGDGSLAILPPSAKDGHEYRWIRKSHPMYLSQLPQEWVTKLKKKKEIGIKEFINNWEDRQDNPFVKVYEGERSNTSTKIISHILAKVDKSYWEWAGWGMARKWNQDYCEPPLDEGELRRTFDWCKNNWQDLAKEDEIKREDSIYDSFKPIKFCDVDDNVPDIEWIWEDFIAPSNLHIISAIPKAGKTTFLLSLLLSMNEKETFMGRKITKTETLYVSEEPMVSWQWRKKRFKELPIHLVPRSFKKKMNYDEWAQLIDMMAKYCEFHKIKLIFLDTADKFWGVDDENSSIEINKNITPLFKLTEMGIAVVIVNHERKSGGLNGLAVRGSNAITGACDVVINFDRYNDKDFLDNKRKIGCISRLIPNPIDLLGEFNQETFGYDFVGNTHEYQGIKDALFLKDYLPKEGEQSMSSADLRTALDEDRDKKINYNTLLKHLNNLERLGYIRKEMGGYVWLSNRMKEEA